ncbi:MAG: alanine dehydrogenase [Opitutales bacterium]|nr:alanine dehydrogenase [Opitutales bacterium]
MKIGIVKEIKVNENRVGIIPGFVASLTQQGHTVLCEQNAGVGSGFSDTDYKNAGASLLRTADEVWQQADMIVKVKEPLPEEYKKIRAGQILFTYLHLAPDVPQTEALIKSGAVCIAYETVTDNAGRLPLLSPMSAIAGRMSVLMAANLLQTQFGGEGILPSGVPGVLPAKVLILGGGNVGQNAAFIAHGIGADVTVLDHYQPTLDSITKQFHNEVKTAYSNSGNIAQLITQADIVIGAALVAGLSTPKLVTKAMIQTMKRGSVIVDVAIDQGGCCETSRPTTHKDPYYEVNGVVHYCVTNMPGAYAHTSTVSLNNATYPFIEKLANLGYEKALREDRNLRNGLNVYKGELTHPAVAASQKRDFTSAETVLGMK